MEVSRRPAGPARSPADSPAARARSWARSAGGRGRRAAATHVDAVLVAPVEALGEVRVRGVLVGQLEAVALRAVVPAAVRSPPSVRARPGRTDGRGPATSGGVPAGSAGEEVEPPGRKRAATTARYGARSRRASRGPFSGEGRTERGPGTKGARTPSGGCGSGAWEDPLPALPFFFPHHRARRWATFPRRRCGAGQRDEHRGRKGWAGASLPGGPERRRAGRPGPRPVPAFPAAAPGSPLPQVLGPPPSAQGRGTK